MSRPATPVVIALLVPALLVAGCASSDDTASDPTTTTPASTTTATETTTAAAEGEPGLGDPYFPGLGNGGYDVAHYDLALEVDPTGAGAIRGVATIEATATQRLAAFHLDLAGLEVDDTTVDGEPASTSREADELRIEPATAIDDGAEFDIEVRYRGTPRPLDSGVTLLPDVGWFDLPNDAGSYVVSEPSGAATFFPANDHPSDKATFTFRITVPEGMEAAANGVLASSTTDAGSTTWTWQMEDPMAPYLATVAVGQLTVDEAGTASGVPIRNVFADSLAEQARPAFESQGDMLTFFAEQFGPYPFDVYGAVVSTPTSASPWRPRPCRPSDGTPSAAS